MFRSILLGRSSGFGESIILILPDSKIGIIDSAINHKTKEPLALEYFSKNSISTDDVDFVLLTHFHQDHYTGITEILKNCKNARFFASKALFNSNFDILLNMLLQINGIANPYHEFKKIADSVRTTKRKILAIGESSKPILATKQYQINVHSPNISTVKHFDNIYLSQIADLRKSPAIIPVKKDINLQSTVVEVSMNGHSFLYSSDLEYTSKPGLGLKSVINKFIKSNNQFKIFKVPHHGSDTGYDQNDWTSILVAEPILKLTPYNSSDLPKIEMITKIKMHSSEVYITCLDQDKYTNHKGKLKKRIEALEIDMKRISTKSQGEICTEYLNGNFQTSLVGTATQV